MKKELRKEILARRNALSVQEREEKSEQKPRSSEMEADSRGRGWGRNMGEASVISNFL